MKGISKHSLSEVKSMVAPPALVKTNVLTTLLLLGHFEEETTQQYRHAKAFLAAHGPKSLVTRTAQLKVEDVPLNVALGAREWMKDCQSMDVVRSVSCAAAEFAQWNLQVIEAVLSRYSEDDISKTEPRTKFHTEPPPEEQQQQ